MNARPYVLISAALSLDGCLDDTSDTRLLLSNEEDFDRVDAVRAGVDAILVGANTVRADNPRLLVRSAERRQHRVDTGHPAHPVKVALTSSGELDPGAEFFTAGDSEKLVYAASGAVSRLSRALAGAATIVDAGDPLSVPALLADLAERDIARLMVEGGGNVHTSFLTSGVVDELQLVYAPMLIGEADAPRLVHSGSFPQRMRLVETRTMGSVVLLRYLTGEDYG